MNEMKTRSNISSNREMTKEEFKEVRKLFKKFHDDYARMLRDMSRNLLYVIRTTFEFPFVCFSTTLPLINSPTSSSSSSSSDLATNKRFVEINQQGAWRYRQIHDHGKIEH